MQDKLTFIGSLKILIIAAAVLAVLSGYCFAVSPDVNGCCPTDTAPVGHVCPAAPPCDPAITGFCTSCWEQGLRSAENILTPIQTDPGGWLFGPGVGAQEFSTFDTSNQFEGSIYGDSQQMYFVGGFAVCFAGATNTGINILLKSLTDFELGTYVDVGAFTASGIGRQGFAQCPDGTVNWDSVDAGGQCEYYGWQFNPANTQIVASVATANQWSSALQRPPHLAFDNFTCVSPQLCSVTTNTVVLNWNFLLNLTTSGIMDAIIRQSPQYQVTKYSAGTLPPECMSFSIVSYEDMGGNSPVAECWHGEGSFVNCRSITSLQNAYGSMEILSSTDRYAVNSSEKEAFFYEDPTTGLQIRSPAGMVIEQGEARTEFGSSNRCRVYNYPFGSRESGWINRLGGPQTMCGQGDWSCIYDVVRTTCAQYENNENCRLVEEFVDGIPTIQFGNNTNFVGERDGVCWNDMHNPVLPDDPALQPPDLTGTPWEDLELYRLQDALVPGTYYTCGDFNYLDRRYTCTGDRIVDSDAANNDLIHQQNLDAAINQRNMSVDVDLASGIINSYTFDGATTVPVDAQGDPLTLGADGDLSDCPAKEQSCIVSWRENDAIYGDGRTRENVLPTDDQGFDQTPPTETMLNKQLRACEIDNAGDAYCPYDPAVETLESDCNCQNLIGEALASLSMLRTVSNDVQCYNTDTDQFEYVDAYMQAVDELRGGECGDETLDITFSYYCSVTNQTLSSRYATLCRDMFHRRSQLEGLSLFEPPSQALPLQEIRAVLSTDDTYQCSLSWEQDPMVMITPGPISPSTEWFNTCYSQFVPTAQTYITTEENANYGRIPDQLCAPELTVANYLGSRPQGGCGFDNWIISSGPTRTNNVGLDPFSDRPFGYVDMTFEVERQFDNNAANSLDCNSDGWLECFSCVYRNAGYDCDRNCLADQSFALCDHIEGIDCQNNDAVDYSTCPLRSAGRDCDDNCISDNNASFCNHISGIDCNSDQAVDYASCTWRSNGYDCNNNLIADNDYTLCDHVEGYDCYGTAAPDYSDCTSRSSGYDYDGDCIRDSSESPVTSASLCGTHQECDPDNPTDCWDEPNTCSGTWVSAGWDCYGSNCEDYSTGSCTYRDGYDCSGNNIIDNNYHYCPYRSSGWDCYGNALADSGCSSIDGYDCGLNGGPAENFSPDGRIDNNINYCPWVDAGYDCFGDNCEDPNCEYINGYDCGTNGGAQYNQSPDGVIDNNMSYCAHVAAGYDCSGTNCDGNHPTYNAFSDNGINGGTCTDVSVLADTECVIGNHRCSRFDEPGRCGNESTSITLTIPIENRANEYYCELNDEEVGNYMVADLYYTAEERFAVEGCQAVLNEVYFNGPVSVTQYGIDLSFQYIRYEDLIDLVARDISRCEWRDKMTISSCDENPYHDREQTYIYVDNLSNSQIELVP